jgi:hypothetical protein
VAHPQGWNALLGERHHHRSPGPEIGASGVRQSDAARSVIDHGFRLANADTCTLYRLNGTTGDLVLIGEQGCNPAVLPYIQRIGEDGPNPIYRTISTGRSLWVETAQEYHELYPSLAALPSEGTRAIAFWSVPLIAEGRAIGLVGMGYFKEQRSRPSSAASSRRSPARAARRSFVRYASTPSGRRARSRITFVPPYRRRSGASGTRSSRPTARARLRS